MYYVVGCDWEFLVEGFVDVQWFVIIVNQQVFWIGWEVEWWVVQWGIWCIIVVWFDVWWNWFWEWWFVVEFVWVID